MKQGALYTFVILCLLSSSAWGAICGAGLPSAPPAGSPCIDSNASNLNFGTVIAPLSGTRQIRLRLNGNINRLQTDIEVVDQNTSATLGRIRGTNNSDITINVTSSSVSGLVLKNFIGFYQSGGFFFDTGGVGGQAGPYPARPNGRRLRLAATMEVPAGIAGGTYIVPFALDVEYDNCTGCNSQLTYRAGIITVVEPITFTALDELDFGAMTKPSSGMATIRQAPTGGISTVSGSVTLLGGNSPGRFQLTAEDGTALLISASQVSAASPGLGLSRFVGLYNGSTQIIDNSGSFVATTGADLFIGADLSVNAASVQTGSHVVLYDITIDYN